ncbi:MAG: GNAT family N-acetyltransferase [Candidatus Marinimicrobia bacterium]|jgi:predicted GNAT family N-acyltransferase|nr:GNAT family N-acetyltransferase [Candidatus Neomarinimicrobiota bacterium]MBT4069413.1 GNAT family N-acetyltransferase [Candidatus Neomarinimicrobiota bacterium]MBT4271465.1 GNAT family N-acetyltransferase [Candidatus Neomarinimicrobiota bacterium]MBT6637949.1 GNAT family N-acetyltransferase [Candidatus Neomarinimicrobiota bacterium]MBT7115185.1 GNAT family N-acetyltransferase [Candidatus Neomarinimicrobiota bacterium]
MEVQVKIVETAQDKDSVLSIRKEVFIKGLNIPEQMEIDANEDKATYVLANVDGQSVGTARWRKTDVGIKLERFAVLEAFRSNGVGKKMTQFILNHLDQSELIYLNAQESAIGFYEKLGFKSTGPKFKEANIVHQKMIYPRGE